VGELGKEGVGKESTDAPDAENGNPTQNSVHPVDVDTKDKGQMTNKQQQFPIFRLGFGLAEFMSQDVSSIWQALNL